MIIIKRTVIGLFTGLVGGAIFGSALSVAFGLPTYFAGHSFFEKLEQLVLFAGFIGAEAGLIVGGIIGIIIGVFGLRKLYGALTGFVVVLILALYFVGPPASFHEPSVLLTILSALSVAALGALIAAITNWFQGPGKNTPGRQRKN